MPDSSVNKDKTKSGVRGYGPMKPPGRGGAPAAKKKTPPAWGTPRRGGINTGAGMTGMSGYAKGTRKCKECGKSASSCKC